MISGTVFRLLLNEVLIISVLQAFLLLPYLIDICTVDSVSMTTKRTISAVKTIFGFRRVITMNAGIARFHRTEVWHCGRKEWKENQWVRMPECYGRANFENYLGTFHSLRWVFWCTLVLQPVCSFNNIKRKVDVLKIDKHIFQIKLDCTFYAIMILQAFTKRKMGSPEIVIF